MKLALHVLLLGCVSPSLACERICGDAYAIWGQPFTMDASSSTRSPEDGGQLDAHALDAGVLDAMPPLDDAGLPEDASTGDASTLEDADAQLPPTCPKSFRIAKRILLPVAMATMQGAVLLWPSLIAANTNGEAVWFTMEAGFAGAAQLGRLELATGGFSMASLAQGTFVSGLVADPVVGAWIGYREGRVLSYFLEPRAAASNRFFLSSADDRQGLARDARGRLLWIESTMGFDDRLAFTLPASDSATVTQVTTLENPSGGRISALAARNQSVWFSSDRQRAGSVTLSRQKADGTLDQRSIDLREGDLIGEARSVFAIAPAASGTVWLLLGIPDGPIEYWAVRVDDPGNQRALKDAPATALLLRTGSAAGITAYESCGALVSHSDPPGITVIEDGKQRELIYPTGFEAKLSDGGTRSQGAIVEIPDGVAFLETEPPAIVFMREAIR